MTYRIKKRLRELSGREILTAGEVEEYVALCKKLPRRLRRKLVLQSHEQWMLELRPWYRKLERSDLGGYAFMAVLTASFVLLFVDAGLQRAHHPVRLPVVGWIGVHHPADPGDCDYTC